MFIPPKYILTPKISQLLSSIEASREVINSISIPPEIEMNIRRQSTLKSSLFSARIEGNNLTLDELTKSTSKNQRKVEVFNILKALNWTADRGVKDISLKDILQMHNLTLMGLIEKDQSGKFRKIASAIFNSGGIAIYMTPRPSQIELLLNKLLNYINSSTEPFIPVKAILSHYTFEKIHPFLDGNGRVGRLILQASLQKGGFGMKGLLSLEEYLDNHRGEYYSVLEVSDRDATNYLEFMLEATAQTAVEAKKLILNKKNIESIDLLLPRRAEILNIIREQNMVNFDTLRRRFSLVNERTLRYDLKYLVDRSLIKKLGSTKGVYYGRN